MGEKVSFHLKIPGEFQVSNALIAAALAMSAGPRTPPVATSVTCGQTVTSSVRLTNDLTDCSGDGLVIGADAITVNPYLGGEAVSPLLERTDRFAYVHRNARRLAHTHRTYL